MQKTLVLGAIAAVVGLSGFAAGSARQFDAKGAGQPAPTFEVDGKIFGTPEAKVFTERYDGPAVSGDSVTMAPYVAPLPPGTRTHQVRMDVVVQTVEVAPGSSTRRGRLAAPFPVPSSTCARGTVSSSR